VATWPPRAPRRWPDSMPQRDAAFLTKLEEGGFEKLLMEVDEPFHLKLEFTREESEFFEAAKEMFGLPDDFEEIVLLDPRDRSLGWAKVAKARGGLTPTVKKERVSKERISLNAPCPCGSGKKYKRCCARA